MQLKTWLLVIRILNILCATLMVGFEIWYTVELFMSTHEVFIIIIRIFMPIFVILLAITILTSEFKYSKVVEHFKFLQYIPGLALFNLLYISNYKAWLLFSRSSLALSLTKILHSDIHHLCSALHLICDHALSQTCRHGEPADAGGVTLILVIKLQQYSMQLCCPSREADEVYISQQLESQYRRSKEPHNLNSAVNAAIKQKGKGIARQPLGIQLQSAKQRVLELSQSVQMKKGVTWRRMNYLQDKSEALKKKIEFKNNELQQLCSGINQAFSW